MLERGLEAIYWLIICVWGLEVIFHKKQGKLGRFPEK
jgi:hypothetical protein